MFRPILARITFAATALLVAASARPQTVGPFAGSKILSNVLPNGMKLILREDRSLPLVALDLWVKNGSADDPQGQAGLSHLLEHALFMGTPKRPDGPDDEIESLGGSLEAATSKDWQHFYCAVPSSDYRIALDVLSDLLENASIPEEGLEREKGVILDELRVARADPLRDLSEKLASQAYGNHPYGQVIPGDATALKGITRQAILDAKKSALAAGDVSLVMVGDFDAARATEDAKKAFSGLPSGKRTRVSLKLNRLTGTADQTVEIPGDSAYVLVGYLGPSIESVQEIAAMDLLYSDLGLGEESQLQRAMVGAGLAYRVEADFLTQRGPGIFSIAAQCAPEKAERAREVIDEAIRSVRDNPLSGEALKSAKLRLLSSFAFDTETFAGQASILGFYDALGQLDDGILYADIVNSLTAQDVENAAIKYLMPTRAVKLTAFPKTKAEAPSPKSGPVIVPLPEDNTLSLPAKPRSSALPSSRSLTKSETRRRNRIASACFADAQSDVETGSTANHDSEKPVTAPKSDSESAKTPEINDPSQGAAAPPLKAPEARRYSYPSGLSVVVKPIPGQQIIAARLVFKAGAMQESKVPAGTAALLSRLLITDAAHPTIKEQLGFLSDQVGGGLSAEPDEDSSCFSALTTKNHVNEAIDLLAFLATKPRLKSVDIELQLQKMKEDQKKPEDPFQVAMRALLNRLYPQSRLGLPVEGDSISRATITPEILESFWESQYRIGNMILVIAGDVDPKAVADRADEAFRKKINPGQADAVPPLAPNDPPNATPGILERAIPVGASVVGVRAPGAAEPSYPALSVLSAILGGGKSSRLFRALRADAGIGYDLGSWSPSRSRFGYLAGFVLTDPYRTTPDGASQPIMETARKIILREMKALSDGKITEKELERARHYVAGTYLSHHQRVSEQAYYLGWWESIGAGFQKDKEYPQLAEKVTQEEVSQLARNLLKDFTAINLMPQDGGDDSTGDSPESTTDR